MTEVSGAAARRWRWRVLAAGAVLAVVWSAGTLINPRRRTPTHVQPVGIRLNADRTGHLPWQREVVVTARGARLYRVRVLDAEGAALKGAVDKSGTTWRSGRLVPDTRYAVHVDLVDTFGRGYVRTATVTTMPPAQRVTATITPGDNDTVGIGMPVIVRFDHAIDPAARGDVLAHFRVEAAPAATGAWRWMTPREVHWRPASYWPAHTTVTASVELDKIDLGHGSWGVGRHIVHFIIGDAHVSEADAATHSMVVTSNGQTLRTLPISAGRQQYPSRNGVHLALAKQQEVTMDSATVGIPRKSPDGYYEKVEWDVRISYAGAFVHAAPWSVPDQGQRNVSHGCINLSTADAQWFYDFTVRGDVIEVHSAGAAPDLADPGTMDWNLSWDAWRAPPA